MRLGYILGILLSTVRSLFPSSSCFSNVLQRTSAYKLYELPLCSDVMIMGLKGKPELAVGQHAAENKRLGGKTLVSLPCFIVVYSFTYRESTEDRDGDERLASTLPSRT